MVFKIQWKLHFWLATQNYPQNDWAGWPCELCGRIRTSPIKYQTDLSKTMHPTMCDLKVSSNNIDTDTHTHSL